MKGRENMKKLLSIIIVIALTMTLFASCGETETALTATELLDLGEKYLLDLDYEQAIVYFNQVIEVEPRNSRAYMGAAEAYVGLGDTESAINLLKTALEVFSDDEEVTIELLEMLIEIEPDNAEWYLDLAQVYANTGNRSSAISVLRQGMDYVGNAKTQLYDKLIEIDSDTTQWYFELADVYEDLSNIPSAVDTLELGLNNFEDDDTKIDFSEELIEIDSTNIERYLSLAQLYVDINDIDSAISILCQGMDYVGDAKTQLYDKLIEIDSDTTQWYFELADVYEDLSNIPSAVDTLELGLNYFDDDETKIDFSEELIEIDETNAEWYLTIANIYIAQGDTDTAIAILRKGLEKASDTTEIEALLNQLVPNISELVRTSGYYYDEDGDLLYVNEYDSNGNLTRQKYSSSEYVYIIKYDTDERITYSENKVIYDDGTQSTSICSDYQYEYDSDGNLICFTYTNVYTFISPDGEEYPSTAKYEYGYEYNSHGDVSKRTYSYKYLSHGNSSSYWVDCDYEYSLNGSITKKVETYSDDEFASFSDSDGMHPFSSQTTEYEYDENGLIASYVVTNRSTDGTVAVWTYEFTYDVAGNVTYFGITSEGTIIGYTYEYEYEYGSDGKVNKCVKTGYYISSGNIYLIETLERIN